MLMKMLVISRRPEIPAPELLAVELGASKTPCARDESAAGKELG